MPSDKLFVVVTGGFGVYNPRSSLRIAVAFIQDHQGNYQSEHYDGQDTSDRGKNGQRTCRLLL